jgi:hypothetical protein
MMKLRDAEQLCRQLLERQGISSDHVAQRIHAGKGALPWKCTTGNGVYSSPTAVNGVI